MESTSQPGDDLLDQQGYIPMADPEGDAAARALWNARFDELAANPPTQEEMRARITAVLEQPRPHPLWLSAMPAPEPPPTISGADPIAGWSPAWVRPQDLIVTSTSDFPYHHTVDQLATQCVRSALDREQAEELGEDLILSQVRRPGGSAFWVDTNGNHRALSFHALGLPVMPALVTPEGNWWEASYRQRHRGPMIAWTWAPVSGWNSGWRVHPTLLTLLQSDGLIEGYDSQAPRWEDTTFYSEHAVAWFAHPNPRRIPDLLQTYEAKFGPLDDPRYDWLRDIGTIRRRMWSHAWPEALTYFRQLASALAPLAIGLLMMIALAIFACATLGT